MGSVGSSLFLADCVKFKGDLGDVLSDFAPCYGPGDRRGQTCGTRAFSSKKRVRKRLHGRRCSFFSKAKSYYSSVLAASSNAVVMPLFLVSSDALCYQ